MENVIVVIVGNMQASDERGLIEASAARIMEAYPAASYTLLTGTYRLDRTTLRAGVTGLAMRLLGDNEKWEVKTVQSRDDIPWYRDITIISQSHVILLIGGDAALRQVVKQLQDQGHTVYEAAFQNNGEPIVHEGILPDL